MKTKLTKLLIVAPIVLLLSGTIGPVTASVTPDGVGCSTVQAIGTVQRWTPIILLNSPYGGSATGQTGVTVTGSYGFNMGGFVLTSTTSTAYAASISASNGQTAALFELDTWTIYLNKINCPQKYSGVITAHGGQMTATLQNQGTTNDLNVPTTWSYNGISSITFNVRYTANDANPPYVDTCSGGPVTYQITTTTTTSIGISISFTLGQYAGTTVGSLDITNSQSGTTSWTYTFNGYTGFWDLHSLRGSAQNGGLAFYYAACNSKNYLTGPSFVYGHAGGGVVTNPAGILNAPDGSDVLLAAPNFGDSAFEHSNFAQPLAGDLQIYAYSYNNHAGGYTSHIEVSVSSDANTWTLVYSTQWSPSSTNTPTWIDLGKVSLPNGVKYVQVVAVDDYYLSAHVYIDSVSITVD